MSNKRKKEKGRKQPPWISVYRHTWKSAAWKALSIGARALYVELAANYNTKRKNAVYIAARTGAKMFGVSKNTTIRWLYELEHYGIIAKVCGGYLGSNGEGKAALYRLTDRWYGDQPPTYDFEKWNGKLFEPTKQAMTEADKKRLEQRRQKQDPVPRAGTPRASGRYIRGVVPGYLNAEHRPSSRDIRGIAERPSVGDLTSLTSCQRVAEPEQIPVQPMDKMEWTTPTLTEITLRHRTRQARRRQGE